MHPFAQGGAGGIHAARPVWPHRDGGMLITPVIDMVGKQIAADTQLGHAAELAGICHLAMLQRMPVIGPWAGDLRCLNGVQHQFGRLVTIGMDMKMQPGLVIAHNQLGKGFRIHVP